MPTKGRAPSEQAAPNRLTATHDGFGRERVVEIQRARMLSATVEVVSERGAGNVTVADVVSRSGVSRRTFYEIFEDREDCFLAAFDDAIEKMAARVVPPYEGERKWREKIRAGLTGLLEFLEYEPGMGRLVIVETLGAGPRALERRRRVLAQVITVIDQGRRESKRGEGPPPLTAEGVVGAVLSVIHTRLLARLPSVMEDPGTGEPSPEPLVELVNPLMSMVVLPYFGAVAARGELDRPTPARNGTDRVSVSNLLKGLKMRLTYRTVRVLMAVGSHPGVSNRRVGAAAGVSDQGQISKLLARLQYLGLIENAGFGQARGESNSWHLSARGRDIERAIREQAERH
jgi:AcrR family transcriptional regulator